MSLFGNLINPKIAINLIRKQIEKNTGHNCEKFSIVYIKKEKDLTFIVKGEKWILPDSENITKLIEGAIKSKMKKTQSVDIVKIDIDGEQIKVTTFFIENGEKQYTSFDL
jgi:hypothetical protein